MTPRTVILSEAKDLPVQRTTPRTVSEAKHPPVQRTDRHNPIV